MSLKEFEVELRRRFARHQEENPRYSLRAFARDLGFPASTIQKVLSGERRMSPRFAKELAAKFGIVMTNESFPVRGRKKKDMRLHPLDPHSRIQVNWVNLAILEMIKLEDFKADVPWVARRLGLSDKLAETILRQMEDAGMLKREEHRWVDLLGESAVAYDQLITTDLVRSMQKEILRVSSSKVDQVPYEEREHSFNIFPISKSELPRLKKRLVKLRRDLMTYAEAAKESKDEIYSLQIGFFPLTQKESP